MGVSHTSLEFAVLSNIFARDKACADHGLNPKPQVRLEEEARKKASDKDDAVARALDGMMGGTLEVRKVDDSIVDLEKPVFYDDEGLSDEQIKACREYDKRLQVKPKL